MINMSNFTQNFESLSVRYFTQVLRQNILRDFLQC